MIHYRVALAASVLLATVHCTTSQAPPPSTEELARPVQRASSLTVPAGTTGNGPHAMVVCQVNSGTNDCNPGAADITGVTGLNAALLPPDAWFTKGAFPIAFPNVHSWTLGQPINFWSYTGTVPDNTGAFFGPSFPSLDDRSLFPGSTTSSGAQFHFTRLFTGFIALPAGSTTRSFSIASDDGYAFALGGTSTGLVTASDFGNHSMVTAYRTISNTFDATFPDSVRLYPFALAAYQNGSPTVSPISGVEFSWASGPKAAAPTFSGNPSVWDSKTFSLVPSAQIFAPDIRATMTWSGVSNADSTVVFTALVRNAGPVAAFAASTPSDVPANSCDGGLCFTLALPSGQFDPASIFVNGSTTAATVTDNGTNILLPVPFASSGATQLLPGDSITINVAAKIATGITPGTRIYAQGRVTGHGTDPTIFGPSSFAPPYSFAVLTNDVIPGADNASLFDSGNRPSGFTGTPQNPVRWEFGSASVETDQPPPLRTRVPVVTAELGGDDDDATLIIAGSTAPGTPTFNQPAPLVSGLQKVTISGISSSLKVRVALTNSQTPFTQATCPSLGAWSWDAGNGECACRPTSTTAWSCDAIALPDCAPGTQCYEATVSVADATGDIAALSTTRQFGVVAPTTTITAVLSTKTFHAVTVSGNVSSNVVPVVPTGGTPVAVKLTKDGTTFTCSTTVAATGDSWTCDAPLACAGTATSPCIIDGIYDVAVALTDASGAAAPIHVPFVRDTQPTFVAPPTTNTQTPRFSGALKGVPPTVLVCQQGATACSATVTTGVNRPLCVASGATGINGQQGTWTCTPTTNITPGAYTTVAYEVDANRNLSAASAPLALLVNTTRPTLTRFPGNLLFNIATSTLVGGNACAPGETVDAKFNVPALSNLASATCSTPCAGTGTNGSWNCVLPIPAVDRTAALSILVSQTPSDTSGALTSTTPGFTVDTLAPRAPTIAAPANGAATRQTSPALQITAAEAGGKVAVSVLDGAGTEVASCPAQAVSTSLAVTCSPTPALADGVYTLSAVQTDLALNPSAPGTSTLRVKTRTATPLLSSQLVGKTLANPVHIDGTAEPGTSVSVKIDDGAPLAAVTTDAGGHFSASAGVIATGAHFVVATATDSLGNTAPSAQEQFDVSLQGHLAGSGFGCSSAGGSGTFGALLLLGLVPLLARRRNRKGIALAAALAAGAGAARADGTDLGLDNFRPASGGDGTIGVEGARPLEDGEASWEARGLLVGQSKPLMFVPDGGGEAQSLIRSRVGGWLSGQGHLWGPLSLGVQLPFLVQQSGNLSGLPSNVSGGAVLGGGLGDLRTTMRAAILRQERSGFDLAMQGSLDLPTAKKESFLGDSSLQGEALAAAGYRWAFSQRSALDLLGNLYFRFRPERDVLGVKTGDELGLRAGLAWLPGGGPFAPQRVIFEVEGAAFLRAGLGDGSVPGEWRGGVSYCAGPMTFDLALGGALSSGIGTPGVRIIGGVGFSPSVCGSNSRGAPVRPPNPVHLTEAAPPAAPPKPETALVAAPSSATAEPKPAPVGAATAAPKTGAKNEVTMLPLPDLPPLPPPKTAKKSKRTVASAEPMPSMPALPAVSAMPLPTLGPRASLSGDRVEFANPVAFSGSRLPAKEPTLDGVARLLIAHPEIALVGVSAPDEPRAKAVAGYLRKHGVASDRLRVEGQSDAVEIKVLRRR